MNYIKQLEVDKAELKTTIASARTELMELFSYLQSTKFHEDRTVQVQDIYNRMDGLKDLLM
jgi:site-specific recombinase XerD